MAKYPVESDDNVGVIDALNYLLSGPAGLGQDFNGFSSFAPTNLTGNYRPPFGQDANLITVTGSVIDPDRKTIYVNGDYSSIIQVGMYVMHVLPVSNYNQVLTVGTYSGGVTPITISQDEIPIVDGTFYFTADISLLYVAPITLSTISFIDDRTIQANFASVQPSVPFSLGDPVTVTGVSVSYYNQQFKTIGIVDCTTSYCIIRVDEIVTGISSGAGGSITLNIVNELGTTNPYYLSTDCNAKVTVTGPTDKVFVSGQLSFSVRPEIGAEDYSVLVMINRYYAVPNNNAVNPDYVFLGPTTIAQVKRTPTGGGYEYQDAIFTNIFDQPGPGYYWYILEIYIEEGNTSSLVQSILMNQRSLSAQVVKQ